MKRKDVQKCANCGKGVMHTKTPFFYTVKIDRCVIDPQAVQEVAGLEQMIGSVQIAQVMGPDPDIAHVFTEGKTVWLCDHCAFQHSSIAQMAEENAKDEDDES